MEIIVVAAFICAVFTAVVASSKGRSGIGWFVAGLLFNIFALIAVAGMPPLTAENRPPKADWVAFLITLGIVFGSIGAFVLFAKIASSAPSTLVGEVTYVRDGDTIEVDGAPIRLNGLAAPEHNELGYHTAKAAMVTLALGKVVECELNGERSYDRFIGVCYLEGVDLGATMVKLGVARDCPRYSGGRYRDLERIAATNGSTISIIYPLPRYC